MERLKHILKHVCRLSPLPTVLISVPSFVLCFYFLAVNERGVPAYISYGLSAYALVITVTGITGVIRALQAGIRSHPMMKKILSLPVGKRFFEDAGFRTKISLYQGFFISLLYIVLKIASGIYYRSMWFIAIAIYYILLAAIRFLLFYRINTKTEENDLAFQWRRYRFCGIMLLFINQALAGIVVFIVRRNRGYDYPGMLIYAMAAYTFYMTIIAVIHLVKFKKYGSPVLSAAKAINLVAAMVSMLSLTTAMLAQFGEDDDPLFRKVMTGAVGGGVCLLVFGMAVFMIVRSTKKMRQARAVGSKT